MKTWREGGGRGKRNGKGNRYMLGDLEAFRMKKKTCRFAGVVKVRILR